LVASQRDIEAQTREFLRPSSENPPDLQTDTLLRTVNPPVNMDASTPNEEPFWRRIFYKRKNSVR
jgi:hypothetical protein